MATDTESKIKAAARKVFKQKGFSATRTRDIADEAGVNLALLNYYFKSKEQLFKEIMRETLEMFKKSIIEFLNDDTIDFMSNLQRLVDSYIQLWLEEPDLPMFFIGELYNHQQEWIDTINPRSMVVGSVFEKQMREFSGNPTIETFQIFMNIMSLIMFPFVGKPIVQNLVGVDDAGFRALIEERRKMIPYWVENMITISK